jgi:hypothetical protein
MQWNEEEPIRSARTKRVTAAVGGGAILLMVVMALHAYGATVGTADLPSAGPMTTGVTSTETVPAESVAPPTVAISEASPTVKATPEWGQPHEP